MDFSTTDAGGSGNELATKATEYFVEAAEKEGLDITNFNPDASLREQISWAESQGLLIGCTYMRYSSQKQHSIDDQLRENIFDAARLNVFIPSRFVCVDKKKKGGSYRRAGFKQLKKILKCETALVVILFKLSRIHRNSYRSKLSNRDTEPSATTQSTR